VTRPDPATGTPGHRPLVSVVTPALNAAQTIESCLISVDNQSYPSIEHIVVDGGSTDGTIERIEAFPGRVTVVREPDRGMYEAVNRGVRLARGEVLAYLNADDLYLPWTVEVAVETLSLGCDLVYGDLAVVADGERPSFRPQFYREFDLRHYTHHEALAQPTVFWWRRVTERIGPFDEGYGLIADVEYWLRAATAGLSLRHVDEIMAIQRDHPGMLRARRRRDLEREFARLRAAYAASAGRPAPRALAGARIRMEARARRASFWLASRNAGARRWPRFARLLRDHGMSASVSGLAWFLLPGRLRPASASMVDVGRLEEALALPRGSLGGSPGSMQ
jgi:glycosyltransferase involved in cell wall biosynthesis